MSTWWQRGELILLTWSIKEHTENYFQGDHRAWNIFETLESNRFIGTQARTHLQNKFIISKEVSITDLDNASGGQLLYWIGYRQALGHKLCIVYWSYFSNTWSTYWALLTLPMLRLFSSKIQRCKYFWKPSKPCHVDIHSIALAEHSQMSTHMPGFQSFFRFFASFGIGQISHQQHKG